MIFALARSGRSRAAPAAVGAYIGAAYFFTSSTSFANPAITIGRMFSATFAGIAPASVPGFMAAQIIGAGLAVVIIRILYPALTAAAAASIVVPHRLLGGPVRLPVPGRGVPGRCRAVLAAPERRRCDGVPSVLFVCIHNAGRSQMAAALLDHEARGRVRVASAGSQPAAELNPAVVAAMAEIGLDLSREFPKPLTGEQVQAADVVITMGCGDACPFYPGKRYLDWDLPDPAGLGVDAVRPIRDDIRQRVRQLLSELDVTG